LRLGPSAGVIGPQRGQREVELQRDCVEDRTGPAAGPIDEVLEKRDVQGVVTVPALLEELPKETRTGGLAIGELVHAFSLAHWVGVSQPRGLLFARRHFRWHEGPELLRW
jgi:hypothetical protein